MRILYGITKSNFGGAQRYVFDLALESKKLGHDVAVLCGGEGSLVEKLRSASIRVISIPYLDRNISILDDIRALFFIYKTLKQEDFDIFHINSAKMGGLGALAGCLTRVKKIIFTAHGWAWNENRSELSRLIIKSFSWLTIILSHQTIAVSNKIKDETLLWPFSKNKIVVIENGIKNFALFSREEARKHFGIREDEFVVGTISELHHVKGLDYLITAWSEFKKTMEGKLLIIGAGEEEESLKVLVNKLGVSESVKFAGFVDDARSFLKVFDVFTLTSRSEGLPYALLEAGFAGLPIIASEIGGIPEVIDNNQDGLLIKVGDTNQIQKNLEELMNNPERRTALGKSIQEKVQKNFSLDKMVHATLKLYV
jgi:Glycosyltransferase